MRKFLVWTGSVLLFAALGCGVWWSWPILFPPLPAGWLSTLAKVDAALLQDRPDLARLALKDPPGTLPVNAWLQWEKRVQAVAVRTEAWEWASEHAQAAQAQYPGNPELTAYLVWTLLKSGHPAEALSAAQKVLPRTPWAGLLVQATIEAEGLTSGDWSTLKEMAARPSLESLNLYQKLVNLDPDSQLRKNALLAALAEGRLEEAREHLGVLTPQQRETPPFDRLQGLMAYDQGDWNRAAALLKALPGTRPETLMVLADVYLHLGDAEQARIIYDQLLADGVDTPSLLVNRATLALAQGDPSAVLRLLDRPTALTGDALDRTRLLVLEARFQLGEPEAVRRALDTLLSGEETPLALEAELLKGRLFPDWTSQPRLSSLLHRHPEFSPLAERLAWLLLVAQDYPAVHRVLDLHDLALGRTGENTPWWSHWLRGLVFAMEDRLEESVASLNQVPVAWRDATFYASLAMVYQIQGQRAPVEERKPFLENSLQNLTVALDQMSPRTDGPGLKRRSLWLTRKGEVELSLVPLQIPARRATLRSAAVEDFRQAVQLDPENLRASFLWRQSTLKQETP